jgi:hypothetical protein
LFYLRDNGHTEGVALFPEADVDEVSCGGVDVEAAAVLGSDVEGFSPVAFEVDCAYLSAGVIHDVHDVALGCFGEVFVREISEVFESETVQAGGLFEDVSSPGEAGSEIAGFYGSREYRPYAWHFLQRNVPYYFRRYLGHPRVIHGSGVDPV